MGLGSVQSSQGEVGVRERSEGEREGLLQVSSYLHHFKRRYVTLIIHEKHL